MSDIHPCQYDHIPDHRPSRHGEKGYCRVCLEYDYTAFTAGVSLERGVHLGMHWTPSPASEIEARMRRAGLLPVVPTAPQPTLPAPNVKSEASLDERALAVFLAHTDWTKKRIAEHLGTHEKCLAPKRCPKLTATIAAHKSRLDPDRRRLHGSKDKDGNLEAWADG